MATCATSCLRTCGAAPATAMNLHPPSRAFTGTMRRQQQLLCRKAPVRGASTVTSVLDVTAENFESEVVQVRCCSVHSCNRSTPDCSNRILGVSASRCWSDRDHEKTRCYVFLHSDYAHIRMKIV